MTLEKLTTDQLLARAQSTWSENQQIHDHPSFKGQPEARYIAELLATRISEVEARVLEFTRSSNQWLVANALMCFDLAQSQAFLAEYDRLCDDSRHVSLIYHSFGHRLSLGAIIRRLKKKYSANPEPRPGLAFTIQKSA